MRPILPVPTGRPPCNPATYDHVRASPGPDRRGRRQRAERLPGIPDGGGVPGDRCLRRSRGAANLAAALRSNDLTRHVPIIGLTANWAPELHATAVSVSMHIVLLKPCVPAHLVAELERLLAHAKAAITNPSSLVAN